MGAEAVSIAGTASASHYSCCPPTSSALGSPTGPSSRSTKTTRPYAVLCQLQHQHLVTVLTALIAFRLLVQLRFSVRESVAGVLALLFCTTHLHYTQNMMENNSILLLTLTGFSFQYEWLRTDNRRALFIAPRRWD